MSNKLNKSNIIFQMRLIDFYLIAPKEIKRDFPKMIDLNDSDYVVRFSPEKNYFEIGYESDKWDLVGQIVKFNMGNIRYCTEDEALKEAEKTGGIVFPLEF